MKLIFFFKSYIGTGTNDAFAQMRKKRNSVPIPVRAQLYGGYWRHRARKGWSCPWGYTALLLLLGKHPLGCSCKEANLSSGFNKPVRWGGW